MRKFLLLATAAICAVSLSAKTIYLNTGGASLWNQANAVFFAHSWASETDNADVQLTNVSGDIYSAEINDGHGNILFVRMPEGATSVIWDGEGKYWNKTGDLSIPEGQNQYNITGWGDTDGNWSVYGGGEGQGGEGGSGSGAKDYFLKGYRGPTQKDIETPTAEEQFEGGILTYSFEGDDKGLGYFFILVCDKGQNIGEQYMCATYTTDVTHATLIKNGTDKFGVPKGSGTVTFYLYDNGDGSFELSTEQLAGKTLVDAGEGGGEGGGEEQAIDNVFEINLDAPMFDILGRQVTSEYHGVVIQNGHKFIR